MNHKAREVKRLHRKAMEYADKAYVAQLEGDREQYLHYTRLALEKEAAAAQLMVDEIIEPTRSVLHRSAATLAWRCEEYDEAKRLIYRALAGNPPADIEEELNDLLGRVKAAITGIELPDMREAGHDFQMTDQTTSQTGVLKIATALETSECVLITQNEEKWTIEVPDEIMNEILGAYFNKEVQVEGKRMKRIGLLQRIRLESKEQIKAI